MSTFCPAFCLKTWRFRDGLSRGGGEEEVNLNGVRGDIIVSYMQEVTFTDEKGRGML